MKIYPFLFCLMVVFSCDWRSTNTTTELTTKPKNTTNSKEVSKPRNIAEEWLCLPGKRVGLITSQSSEQDIIEAYGKGQVIRSTIGLGEGEITEGSILFPNTAKELIIEWQADKPYTKPTKIRIEKEKSPWKTEEGISIGTSLADLRRINGKEFKFAGFEWDYAGIANNWQNGNISPKLTVFLAAKNPAALYPKLIGEEEFSSSHPKAKEADLVVRSMVIGLD